jgi:ribosomal protein S18 acetylase RimI-like enzyme
MKIKEVHRLNTRIFNAVLKLLPQLGSNYELPTRKHLNEILISEKTHFFIAELDNKEIIGMLTIGTYEIPSGTKAWIEDVVVDGSQRGKGFGRDLMLFAIDFASSKGIEKIELTSRPSRIAANQLYQKLGFVLRETNVYSLNLKGQTISAN